MKALKAGSVMVGIHGIQKWSFHGDWYFSPWREGDSSWETLLGCGIQRSRMLEYTARRKILQSVTLRRPEAEALGLKFSAGIWLTHDNEVYESLGSNCVIKFWAMEEFRHVVIHMVQHWEISGTAATTSGRTS